MSSYEICTGVLQISAIILTFALLTMWPIFLISAFHLMLGNVSNLALWTWSTRHQLKASQDGLTTYFAWCGRPTPRSEECRWRKRWRSVRGHWCYYPEFLTHTASLRRCSTQERWPGQGRGSWPASGGPGRIFCGSYGSSRSRRCSWGNRWRLAATPLQTRSTLVRCYPRPLWERAQGWNPESPAPQHKTAAFDRETCTTFSWLDQIDTITLKPWMNPSTDKTAANNSLVWCESFLREK